MTDKSLTPMELDALGEVMNISLGSSATAVSNILGHRVEITTPSVSVATNTEFPMEDLIHVIGVEVHYISGLVGNNLLILKRKDAQTIVDTLMGNELSNDDFQKDDLSVSALCEVMNQMMGSAATALSDFLGFSVNISTPEYFELDDLEKLKEKCYQPNESVCVVVRFTMKIEGIVESQFINTMSMDLVQKMLAGLGIGDDEPKNIASESYPTENTPEHAAQSDGVLTEEEIERLVHGGKEKDETKKTSAPHENKIMSQEEIEKILHPEPAVSSQTEEHPKPVPDAVPGQNDENGGPYGFGGAAGNYQMPPYGQYMPGYYPPPMYYPPNSVMQQTPKVVDAKNAELPHLSSGQMQTLPQDDNLQLLMSVPMEVSVEIGRTQKKVKDILTFSKGTLVVLDRLAGDQVDLFVNGKCIAKGDVVVVDDNFGIRITEVLNLPSVDELSKSNQ